VGLDGYEIAKLIDDPVGCPPIVVSLSSNWTQTHEEGVSQ